MRRRSFLLGGAGLTVGALAGCGSDDDGSAAGAGDDAGFPITISGADGPTKIPSRPTRVVATGYLRDTDLALALGANLVGTTKNTETPSGFTPWQHLRSSTERLRGGSGNLPFEKIAALRPDLILATDDYSIAEHKAKLEKIAPTLGPKAGVAKDSWQTMATRAGQALGVADRARQVIDRTTDMIEATRKRYPQLEHITYAGGPVQGDGQIFTTTSPADASAQLYAELGMRLTPTVRNLPPSSTPNRAVVSPERLDLLDADVLLITYTSASVRKQLEANPLFRRLKVVRRGSYVPVDLTTALSLGFPSVLSIPYGLKYTVPRIAAAAARAA